MRKHFKSDSIEFKFTAAATLTPGTVETAITLATVGNAIRRI